jgi:hypothetical protein
MALGKSDQVALPWMVALRSINGLELALDKECALGRFRTHEKRLAFRTPLRGQCWSVTNFPV